MAFRPVLVALIVAFAAWAQTTTKPPPHGSPLIWEPLRLSFPETFPPPTLPKEMIAALRVAGVEVVLEKTALSELQKHLGGDVGHSGDGGESLHWLCLCGKDAKGRWALWLETSEVAGGTVDGFTLQRLDQAARVDQRCRVLQKGEGGIELPVPLQLGLTEKQVAGILGRFTTKYRETLIFDHEHQETIDNQPFTASNLVAIALRDGVVWAIQVWKNTIS